MFFVLHANVCGNSIPHHGHSHGGNSHGHSHGGNSHGHSHEGHDNHGHSHDDDGDNHSDMRVPTSTSLNDHDLESAKSVEQNSRAKNINVRAAIIHVIGDFVQSIGVLFAALLIHFKVHIFLI